VLSWDDRSSARVQRVFALHEATTLVAIARHADATLAPQGWYLVSPDDLERLTNPQVIVWQRDPDERLDLTQAWPVEGITRTQRMYGGIFPAEFLDSPVVIEWSWALGGPRSPRPAPIERTDCVVSSDVRRSNVSSWIRMFAFCRTKSLMKSTSSSQAPLRV
jgi:hypothetical protein